MGILYSETERKETLEKIQMVSITDAVADLAYLLLAP